MVYYLLLPVKFICLIFRTLCVTYLLRNKNKFVAKFVIEIIPDELTELIVGTCDHEVLPFDKLMKIKCIEHNVFVSCAAGVATQSLEILIEFC
jgi:hypothetical protein